MKIYMLIPISDPKPAKIEERAKNITKCALTDDYSKHFGTDNEYYIDLASQAYSISSWKRRSYKYGHITWYYSALNPMDIIKRERIIKEVKT